MNTKKKPQILKLPNLQNRVNVIQTNKPLIQTDESIYKTPVISIPSTEREVNSQNQDLEENKQKNTKLPTDDFLKTLSPINTNEKQYKNGKNNRKGNVKENKKRKLVWKRNIDTDPNSNDSDKLSNSVTRLINQFNLYLEVSQYLESKDVPSDTFTIQTNIIQRLLNVNILNKTNKTEESLVLVIVDRFDKTKLNTLFTILFTFYFFKQESNYSNKSCELHYIITGNSNIKNQRKILSYIKYMNDLLLSFSEYKNLEWKEVVVKTLYELFINRASYKYLGRECIAVLTLVNDQVSLNLSRQITPNNIKLFNLKDDKVSKGQIIENNLTILNIMREQLNNPSLYNKLASYNKYNKTSIIGSLEPFASVSNSQSVKESIIGTINGTFVETYGKDPTPESIKQKVIKVHRKPWDLLDLSFYNSNIVFSQLDSGRDIDYQGQQRYIKEILLPMLDEMGILEYIPHQTIAKAELANKFVQELLSGELFRRLYSSSMSMVVFDWSDFINEMGMIDFRRKPIFN